MSVELEAITSVFDVTKIQEGDSYIVLVDVSIMTADQRKNLMDSLKLAFRAATNYKKSQFCVIPHYGNLSVDLVATMSDTELSKLGLKRI